VPAVHALVVHGTVRDDRAQRAGRHPDYCKRYGPSLARLSAADPSIYAGEKLAGLLALWERTPDANEVTACMAWRDRRLAALKAHKRAQAAN